MGDRVTAPQSPTIVSLSVKDHASPGQSRTRSTMSAQPEEADLL